MVRLFAVACARVSAEAGCLPVIPGTCVVYCCFYYCYAAAPVDETTLSAGPVNWQKTERTVTITLAPMTHNAATPPVN